MDANPSNQVSVRFTSPSASQLPASPSAIFALVTSGLVGAAIVNLVNVNNVTWIVTATTSPHNGLMSLDVLSANQILDSAGNALSAPSTGNPTYTIDRVLAVLQSVSRMDAVATNATSVRYAVTFSEAVTGLTAAAFSAQSTGLSGAAVTALTGSGANYTVTLNTGNGQGTLALTYSLNVVDQAGNVLSQSGTAAAYLVDRVVPVVQSFHPQESGPTSNTDIFFNIQFTEPVSGVSVQDFLVQTTGAASGVVSGLLTGDNTVYTVRVTVVRAT